jgi:hypothetical protein
MSVVVNKIRELTVDDRPFTVCAPTSTGTVIVTGRAIVGDNGIIKCDMIGDTPLDQRNILLCYESKGKQLQLNCMINIKGEIITNDQKDKIVSELAFSKVAEEATLDNVFMCNDFCNLWLLGLFKPSSMDSPEDIINTLKNIADYYGFNRASDRTGIDEFKSRLQRSPLEFYFNAQLYNSYYTLIDLATGSNLEKQQDGFDKVLEIFEKHMSEEVTDKLNDLFIQVADDAVSDKPAKLIDLFCNTFDSITVNYIMGAFQHHFPLKGKSLKDSNNDYVYSVSSDNFSEVIYGLCANIDKDNPAEKTESFIFYSGIHIMAIKIIKKDNNFKIQLYDPEKSTTQTTNITASSLSATRDIKLSYFLNKEQIQEYNIDGMSFNFDSNYFTTAMLIYVPKNKLLWDGS